MPTNAVLQSRLDIRQAVMERAKIPTTNTTEQAIVNQMMNIHYHEICRMADWRWLYLYQRAIQIPQRYTTGTVNPTLGDSALPGVSTAWTGTNNVGTANVVAGDLLMVGGDNEVYEVRTVGAATSITLGTLAAVTRYLGATATGKSYTAWRYLFNLPTDLVDMVKVYDAWHPYTPLPEGIRTIRSIQMEGSLWPFTSGARAASRPKYYTVAGTAAAPQLFIWPPADTDDITVYYDYKRRQTDLTADADVPFIPEEFRDVLMWAVMRDYALNRMRNSGLADYAERQYGLGLATMKGNSLQAPHSDQPVFRPDMSMYRRRRHRGSVYDPDLRAKV